MTTISSAASDHSADFSLVEGGPLRRLQTTIGLPHRASGSMGFGFALALLAWVPLVVLSAGANTLTSGSSVPFLHSLGTHVRLLLTVPLFFLSEATFDHRVRQVIRGMVRSRLVPAPQVPRFESALVQAKRWRDSWILETGLVIVTVALMSAGLRADLPGEMSTWRHTSTGQPTPAGWWYALVSLPLFQFLLWRWFARLLIWTRLLWQIRGLDLQLMATHPDLSGGLGGLGAAHMALAPLNFGVSSIFVATFAEQIRYGGADIAGVVLPVASVVAGGTFMLTAPLLVFASRLLRAKQRGLVEYGTLAASYTQAFHKKWMRSEEPPSEPLLGSADVQSLADLASGYDVVRHMRLTPIAQGQILILLAAAVLPALPLVLFVVPLDELVIRAARMLLHI